jgi:hypothetical protein
VSCYSFDRDAKVRVVNSRIIIVYKKCATVNCSVKLLCKCSIPYLHFAESLVALAFISYILLATHVFNEIF